MASPSAVLARLALAARNAQLPKSKGGLGLPANNTAAQRAKAMGYEGPYYHGTFSDIAEFDPELGDIGTHVGTPQQANARLADVTKERDFSGLSRAAFASRLDPGANVLPLMIRKGKTKTMPDVGMWKDSTAIMEQLPNSSQMLDLYDAAVGEKELYEDSADWLASRENRDFLDEMRSIIGADTVQYANQVENAYGSSTELLPAVAKQVAEVKARADAVRKGASARRPELAPDATEEQVQEWLDSPSDWSAWATPEEKKLVEKLDGDVMGLRGDRANYVDPNSYIVTDPANIRSRFAAFDPLRKDSSDLLAGVAKVAPAAGMAAAGIGAGVSPDQALAAAIRQESFAPMPSRGMQAAPQGPEWATKARRELEAIQTGGDLATPMAATEALRALEQGRTSGYVNNVLAGLELLDPMMLGAVIKQYLK